MKLSSLLLLTCLFLSQFVQAIEIPVGTYDVIKINRNSQEVVGTIRVGDQNNVDSVYYMLDGRADKMIYGYYTPDSNGVVVHLEDRDNNVMFLDTAILKIDFAAGVGEAELAESPRVRAHVTVWVNGSSRVYDTYDIIFRTHRGSPAPN